MNTQRKWQTIRALLIIVSALSPFVGAAHATLTDDLKKVSERAAPSFDTVNWFKQSELNSQSLQGKVLLVDFWATWCPPCVAELPSIQNIRDSFSREDFEVIAINAGEGVQAIEKFLTKLSTPLTFPIMVDERLAAYADWQVRPLPTTYLVDRAGNIRYQAIGPRDFTSNNIRSIIQDLIDE